MITLLESNELKAARVLLARWSLGQLRSDLGRDQKALRRCACFFTFKSGDMDGCLPAGMFVEKYNYFPHYHEHHPSTILCLLAGEFRQAGAEEQVWGPMRCCQTHESENAPTMGFVVVNAHHTPHGRSRCGTAKPSKRFPIPGAISRTGD